MVQDTYLLVEAALMSALDDVAFTSAYVDNQVLL